MTEIEVFRKTPFWAASGGLPYRLKGNSERFPDFSRKFKKSVIFDPKADFVGRGVWPRPTLMRSPACNNASSGTRGEGSKWSVFNAYLNIGYQKRPISRCIRIFRFFGKNRNIPEQVQEVAKAHRGYKRQFSNIAYLWPKMAIFWTEPSDPGFTGETGIRALRRVNSTQRAVNGHWKRVRLVKVLK